ncbi:MAG TPA: hypothetical protein VLF14_02485 [Candidatus Binatia bacterium]|nr:hypothetical protein [Candidatus Binatia bacterium]
MVGRTAGAKAALSRRACYAAFAAAALAGSLFACSRKQTASVEEARPVMEKFLQAEREYRASHGGYWRDGQPKVGRDAAVRVIGVDIAEAPSFEFTIEPADSGMDPVLRITARGKGEAANVSLACVQDAKEPHADCKATP